jgi:hypothetical protein
LSRRGRDALLVVYLIDLLFLLSPLARTFGLPAGVLDWLVALNPYSSIGPPVFEERLAPAWATVGLWLTIGLSGTAVASWRLRPACLGPSGNEGKPRRDARRLWVPAIDEKRPMLWKELFIERVGSLGRVGSWIGLILVLILIGGSVGLTAVMAWDAWQSGDNSKADWARSQMATWIGGSSLFVSLLIQWAIGLRASVSISSERERGTWDALLTSPLEAGEIVRGKLWGSLYALRWLIVAAYLAWTLSAATEASTVGEAVTHGFQVLILGAFMAAVGVRTSLNCDTATRAMAVTIGIWLGAYVCVGVLAGILLGVGTLLCNFAWILLAQAGLAPPVTTFWFPLRMAVAWPVTVNGVYLLMTLLIVGDTRLRFDRLAGRMTGGKVAVALDALLYGRPEAPVLAELEPEALEAVAPPSQEMDLETSSGPERHREDTVAGPA